MKQDEIVKRFNEILDFCRHEPKRRADIIRHFKMNPDSVTNTVRLLVDKGMLQYDLVVTDRRTLRQYRTVGGSVYVKSNHRTVKPTARHARQ